VFFFDVTFPAHFAPQPGSLAPTNYTIDLTQEPPSSNIVMAICNKLNTLPAGHGITVGTQGSVNFYLQVRLRIRYAGPFGCCLWLALQPIPLA
jgi:hypothetical protein